MKQRRHRHDRGEGDCRGEQSVYIMRDEADVAAVGDQPTAGVRDKEFHPFGAAGIAEIVKPAEMIEEAKLLAQRELG